MACMEHTCRDCNETWFDNKPSGPCPACGSSDISSIFDEEVGEYDRSEYDEWDEDDRSEYDEWDEDDWEDEL